MENGIPKFRGNNVSSSWKVEISKRNMKQLHIPEAHKHQLHHNENLQIVIFYLLIIPLIAYW